MENDDGRARGEKEGGRNGPQGPSGYAPSLLLSKQNGRFQKQSSNLRGYVTMILLFRVNSPLILLLCGFNFVQDVLDKLWGGYQMNFIKKSNP